MTHLHGHKVNHVKLELAQDLELALPSRHGAQPLGDDSLERNRVERRQQIAANAQTRFHEQKARVGAQWLDRVGRPVLDPVLESARQRDIKLDNGVAYIVVLEPGARFCKSVSRNLIMV